MALIDNTYFFGDINLTGGQLNNITNWINTYEDDLLSKLLGYNLKKELYSDLNENNEPQLQIFKDLVNGAEFSFNFLGYTINTKWEGLRGLNKKSIIAYYVYYHYKNENVTINTSVGQKKTIAENAESADVFPKLIYTWNKMIDLYGITPKQYDNNYFLSSDNYEHYNIYPSAYNFLLANKDDYSKWIFEPKRKQNIFCL